MSARGGFNVIPWFRGKHEHSALGRVRDAGPARNSRFLLTGCSETGYFGG